MNPNFSHSASPVIIRPWPSTLKISHVVFDFDGTLSWLRHGWPSIMFELFLSYYPGSTGESEDQIRQKLNSIIIGLNGKPTILQIVKFVEILEKMGSTYPEPEKLGEQYQDRLDQAISRRLGKIRQGMVDPDHYLVFGARSFLEELTLRGMKLFILSTTLEPRVCEEAVCLQISQYFKGNIIGGTGNPLEFSKRKAFEQILEREKIPGAQLLSFGDGPVEIADTCDLGGLSIGVASDEELNGSGVPNPGKLVRLIEAGAQAIIPDFREADKLSSLIWQKQGTGHNCTAINSS